MKLREFTSFIFSRLIIELLLLVLALMNAFLFFPKEASVSLPLVVFIVGAIIVYREEKRRRELRFINRLNNFVGEFREKIANSPYSYSLISIAFWIAHDKRIGQKTIAWQLFLNHLNNNLTKQSILLHERVTQRKGEFTSLFEDFSSLLSLFRNFKKQFYYMVDDTKQTKDFSKNSNFERHYKRFYEEFNKYMDKLDIFSDEVKAEFGLSLSEDLTKHVKDLNELYKS